MRLLVAGFVLLVGVAQPADAQIRKFPYQAVIETDDVQVLAGPGRKYYSTGRLDRGSRVTVHRHDPGGWYMISPPPGSFSWIRADYVEISSGSRGVLTESNVVVHVGSALDDSRDVVQRRLSTGDRVEVLGKQTFDTERGRILMYKIGPPRGEYRWIPGRFVSPASEFLRRQQDRDPFRIPSRVRRNSEPSKQQTHPVAKPEKEPQAKLIERPLTRTTGSHQENTDARHTDRRRIKELDSRFRDIIRTDIADWNFTQLEQGYRQLQQMASDPAIKGQIESRFEALKRYQRNKADYDDFIRLTSATSRRDEELLTLQKQREQQGLELRIEPAQRIVAPVQLGPPLPLPPQSQPFRNRPTQPILNGPAVWPARPIAPPPPPFPAARAPQPRPTPSWLGPTTPQIRLNALQQRPILRQIPSAAVPSVQQQPVHFGANRVPHFDGAGIVQRAATTFPGAPRHVLLRPNGEILAYLQSVPGINLERHVGRSMGVVGKRQFREDLQSDFIVVQNMAPVRLKQ